MSKVRLYGNTSGYVDLQAPDVAGDVTITLPNATGPFALESYVDNEIAAIPAIEGIGSNVVQGVNLGTFATSSTSFTEVTDLEATITPSSATSKILVMFDVPVAYSSTLSSRVAQGTITRGGTNLVVPISVGSRTPAMFNMNYDGMASPTLYVFRFNGMFLDSPGVTTAVTYDFRLRVSDADTIVYVNRTTQNSNSSSHIRSIASLTVIEVAA